MEPITMHEIVILIAKYFIVITVLGVLWVLAIAPKEQRLRMAILLGLGGILTVLFAKIGSHLYYDPRPFVTTHITPYFSHAPDNGFPSDHTLLAAFLAYWVFAYRKALGALLFVVALLIGSARIIAGVHHLNYILGSLLFAALGFVVAFGILHLSWCSAERKSA
jgi:undecaprenyl-diphosphatase